MSRPPPPPPPPPRRISAAQGLPSKSSLSLQQELESLIPKTEEIHEDSATLLYSTTHTSPRELFLCPICSTPVANLQSHHTSHASAIFPWLYLGSMNNSQDAHELEFCGIDTIINTTSECSNVFQSRLKYFNFPLSDGSDNIELLQQASFFLENLRLDGHTVLVHCVQGVCRGPSVVLCYLLKYAGMSLREAFYFVHSKRSIIRPRRAFLSQLSALELHLYNFSSFPITELWASEDD